MTLTKEITEQTFILVAEDEDGLIKEPFGSGFFIAPNLGLTARHVFDEMWRKFNRNTPLPFKELVQETNIKVYAYQYLEGSEQPAKWYGEMIWNSEFTDISFLSLKPINKQAHEYKMITRPEITMDMPQKTEMITAYGYPETKKTDSTGIIELGSYRLLPTTLTARVTELHEQYKDRGMVNWDCFEIDAVFDNGMSGGPVYNERGQICGVVCHENTSSALWRAFFTPVEFENDIIKCSGPYFPFELFEKNYILQQGWDKYSAKYRTEFDILKDDWNDKWEMVWRNPKEEKPD